MELQDNSKRNSHFKVPFSQLRIVEGLNIRSDYGDIQELANSIKENGVKMPLRGSSKSNLYYIVDGHRRFQAMQLLYNEGIEVSCNFIVQEKGTNDEQQVIDMFITNEGKALTPLEQAEGVRRLLAYGWTEKKIADRLAKSPSYINKLNLLNKAPEKLLNLIRSNEISSTLAIDVVSKNETTDFLKQFEKDKAEEEEKEELFEHDKGYSEPKFSERYTRKNFKKVNSFSELKKFVKGGDTDSIDPSKQEAYDFLVKILNNKVTIEDINEFFNS